MTPSVTITPSPAAPIDPYIGNVSLLLQGNNTILNNNTFLDSNTNPLTITRNGNVAQGSFSPFASNIVAGSAYFDGTGDNLTVPSNAVFDYGAGDFTIEFWINSLSATQVVGLIVKRAGETYTNLIISISNARIGVVVNFTGGGNTWGLNVLGTIPINNSTWYHVALVRNGSSFKTYINGVQDTSDTNAGTISFNADSLSIGSGFSTGQYFNGYLSNVRIVKGEAVYTTNFNVPTSPLSAITNTSLLLHFTNGGVLDGVKKNNVETLGNAGISTSVVKYGSGSLVFTGGTSYLNVGNQPDLELLSTDYTVEFWLYKNATAAYMTVCGDFSVSATNTWQILFDVNGTKIAWFNGANNAFTLTSTNIVSNTTWTHIAFVRLGTTLTVYLNGVPNGSATLSTNYSSTTNLFIGHTPELLAGRYLNGYLDDFRITKGVARYTADFSSNLPQQLPSALPNPLSVNYLVVAGGGGSAGSLSGGGGAGGYRTTVGRSGGDTNPESTKTVNLNTPYTITIGGGGSASSTAVVGGNGINSIFADILSLGGGGGGTWASGNGATGGSGGGGAARNTSSSVGGSGLQGFSGGSSGNVNYNQIATSCGGGGAGGAGQGGNNQTIGYSGGTGIQSNITGVQVFRAGGGGGFNYGSSIQFNTLSGGNGGTGGGGGGGSLSESSSVGTGGIGGGNGATNGGTENYNGGNGGANSGGGGGGASIVGGGTGGLGGSGVVVIKISNAYLAQFSSGCTVNGQTSSAPFIPANLSTSEAGFNTYSVTGTTTTSETVTFVDAANYVSVDYLVVAGGGGGGRGNTANTYSGGGGGAGGYRTSYGTSGGTPGTAESKITLNKGTTYVITIGGGGAAAPSPNTAGSTHGTNSSIASLVISNAGGGGGAGFSNTVALGKNGGSGGGAGNLATSPFNSAAVGTCQTAQGFNGGSAVNGGANGGGGGGGASSLGSNGVSNTGGNGGTGLGSTIKGGSSVNYAGGGGGAGVIGSSGGSSVGGDGASSATNGGNGTAFRGGGGGAGSQSSSTAGSGGSGVVIIRSPIDITNSADYSPATRSTDGTDFIFTFEGDGSIKFS
jgi:hypothetical protein